MTTIVSKLFDSNDIDFGVKRTGNTPHVYSDFLLAISQGNIPGYQIARKFGSIDSIAAAIPADVWEYGATSGAEKYTFSDDNVADITTLSSSHNSDIEAITVIGLDITGAEVIQTKNLSGQNKVTLDTPLWRVNRAFNSNHNNLLGNVYIYTDTAISAGIPIDVTTVRGYISIGEGQTLQAMYTVPLGKTGYFMGLETSLTKGTGATAVGANLKGRTREFGKVFRTQDEFNLLTSGNSLKTYNFPFPLPFLSLTDFVPTADVTANGVGVSWAFTLILIDNELT